ncbi:MAG: hypothetical protein ACRECO_18135 [Xanthobacteraceae bacterium]
MTPRTTIAALTLVGAVALVSAAAQAQIQSSRTGDTAPRTSAMLPKDAKQETVRSMRITAESVKPGAGPSANTSPPMAPTSGRK